MARIEVNGVGYWVEEAGKGPAVVLLHGFTGSSRSWKRLVPALSRRFHTVCIDLIGHGKTGAPENPERYHVEAVVEDLGALADALRLGPFFLAGYSMGGRVALHAALRFGERIGALVLESASYGIEEPSAREERRKSDAALAAAIEAGGVEAFVDRWERLPLFASQRNLPGEVWKAQRADRLRHSATGLANCLRGLSPGNQACLLERLPQLAQPVLIVAGASDAKYVEIGRRMQEALPCARLEVVPEAGHNVHLEQSEAFGRLTREFFETIVDHERKGRSEHNAHSMGTSRRVHGYSL